MSMRGTGPFGASTGAFNSKHRILLIASRHPRLVLLTFKT
jgi:hypothetical protein